MNGPADAGGVLVVDKPAGSTSHDVVARVRRLLGTRRVGHAGTLDPMATGVLVIGVGRGTRLLGHLAPTTKEYAATARLGIGTDTDDAEGRPVRGASATGLDLAAVRSAAGRLTGAIDQVPSAVSAVKVAGERAYARVRRGETVALEPRRVTVHELTVGELRPGPDQSVSPETGPHPTVDVDLVVRCSSGTYVRALARDLGESLGVGGHLVALRRTAVGPFTLDLAQTWPQIERDGARLLTLAEAATAVFPAVLCDEEQARAVSHGRPLELGGAPEGPAAAGDVVALVAADGRLLALYTFEEGHARAVTVFAPA